MLKKALIYAIIGIGTIAGIALVLNLAMSVFVGGRQVTVPDLRGLDERRAIALLEEVGLRHEIVREQFNVSGEHGGRTESVAGKNRETGPEGSGDDEQGRRVL